MGNGVNGVDAGGDGGELAQVVLQDCLVTFLESLALVGLDLTREPDTGRDLPF